MSNFSFNPLQVAIKPFYEQAIAEDALFAEEVKEKESRAEKPKSLAECSEYIYGEALKYAEEHRDGQIGLAGCEDAQIVAMIKHYYDEDNIEIYKPKCEVKSSVQTTKEPKKPAKPARPKETLDCVNVPMIRPVDERDAKRGSREQARSVVVMDLFAGMDEEEDDLPE